MSSGTLRLVGFVVFVNIFLHSATGQYTCRDFVEDPHRNVTIRDTFVGIVESLLISDLEDAEIVNSAYLEAYLDYDGFLTIEVIQDFKKYKGDDDVISVLLLDCLDNDYKLEYHINIQRMFCDGITFEHGQYDFVFLDSLPQNYNFDLSDSEEILVICAEDTTVFAIEDNQYLAIESAGIGEDGQYYATLRVLNEIKAPFRGSFNITAWDVKNPEKVATSLVTVGVMTVGFFTERVYYGEVTQDLKIVIYNGPIALDISAFDGFNVVVAADYDSFFDVNFSSEEVELFIWSDITLEILPDFPINLTLEVHDDYLGDTDRTTVILNGPSYSSDKITDAPETKTPDSTSTPTESIEKDISTTSGGVSSPVSEGDVILGSTTTLDSDENDDGTTEEQPDADNDVDNVEDEDQWDLEDESEENEIEEEYKQLNGRLHLAGFEFWATNMKAFVIALGMLSVVMIISAIIYVRNKATAYRRYTAAY